MVHEWIESQKLFLFFSFLFTGLHTWNPDVLAWFVSNTYVSYFLYRDKITSLKHAEIVINKQTKYLAPFIVHVLQGCVSY